MTLVLAALSLEQGMSVFQSPPVSAGCVPIGKLVSRTGDRVATQPVCQGERPTLTPGKRYGFLCYTAAGILNFMGTRGLTLPGCAPPTVRWIPCPADTQARCVRKGSAESISSTMVPHGKVLMETRPTLSWATVPGATSYIVKVKGPGLHWAKSVNRTTLLYPPNEAGFEYGNIYTVGLVAIQAERTISNSTKTFSILSRSSMEQIRAVEAQIQSWNLPADEVASDLDAVYSSKGLLDRAIAILEAQIKAGSKDFTLFQKLGNHYVEVGLPELAQKQYEQAQQLAQTVPDPDAVAQAQAGLELVARLKASRRSE